MDQLNQIRAKLIGRIAFDIPSFEHVANHTKPSKPWMQPYLFEGDIVLTDNQLSNIISNNEFELYMQEINESTNAIDIQQRKKRTLTSETSLWWTEFPIPYIIDSDVDSDAVEQGILNWVDNTCLTFEEISNTSAYDSVLEFIYGDGCYSYIGRVGGVQQISIGYGCNVPGIVSHEIGHSLGYYHEHARFDRNSYVDVVTANIPAAYLSQFSKTYSDQMITFGVEYDLGSVMHYDPYAFSSNGSATIKTDEPNYQDTIGQRVELSFNDIKKINFAYCNKSCTTQLNCQRNGYTDPKNCSRCKCPEGIGGTLCDVALTTTTTTCGVINLNATSTLNTLTISGNRSCNYLITAPSGSHVNITIQSIKFSTSSPCDTSYLEIKYKKDLGNTGPRLCSKIYKSNIISETNEAVILYRGASNTNSFTLTYQIDTNISTTASTLLQTSTSTTLLTRINSTTLQPTTATTTITSTVASTNLPTTTNIPTTTASTVTSTNLPTTTNIGTTTASTVTSTNLPTTTNAATTIASTVANTNLPTTTNTTTTTASTTASTNLPTTTTAATTTASTVASTNLPTTTNAATTIASTAASTSLPTTTNLATILASTVASTNLPTTTNIGTTTASTVTSTNLPTTTNAATTIASTTASTNLPTTTTVTTTTASTTASTPKYEIETPKPANGPMTLLGKLLNKTPQ
uniref:Metalloendopeptidase n=1 Tax=Acrobeloides nanus TaxID=290746 RepID=A0A914E4A6_9BILA